MCPPSQVTPTSGTVTRSNMAAKLLTIDLSILGHPASSGSGGDPYWLEACESHISPPHYLPVRRCVRMKAGLIQNSATHTDIDK